MPWFDPGTPGGQSQTKWQAFTRQCGAGDLNAFERLYREDILDVGRPRIFLGLSGRAWCWKRHAAGRAERHTQVGGLRRVARPSVQGSPLVIVVLARQPGDVALILGEGGFDAGDRLKAWLHGNHGALRTGCCTPSRRTST